MVAVCPPGSRGGAGKREQELDDALLGPGGRLNAVSVWLPRPAVLAEATEYAKSCFGSWKTAQRASKFRATLMRDLQWMRWKGSRSRPVPSITSAPWMACWVIVLLVLGYFGRGRLSR
jgi:hypothetical protein